MQLEVDDPADRGQAVMLRPANERMDVEDAIEEMIRTSFVEEVVASEDNERILSGSTCGVRIR